MKKMKILICHILKAVHYSVYKCTAILHTPMGRTHGENSMSKLDNDAKRVANLYIELPIRKQATLIWPNCKGNPLPAFLYNLSIDKGPPPHFQKSRIPINQFARLPGYGPVYMTHAPSCTCTPCTHTLSISLKYHLLINDLAPVYLTFR